MPRKPKAVILPPEYDDVDEADGLPSGAPDDDGWVTLQGGQDADKKPSPPKPAKQRRVERGKS